MQEVTVIEDDMFIYVGMHDSDMVITYDPDSTPVALLGKAMEHAIRADMDITHQWYDTDLARQVIHLTPRSRRG